MTPEQWLRLYDQGYGSYGRHRAMSYARGQAREERVQMQRDALMERILARREQLPQETLSACAKALGTSRQVLGRMLLRAKHG